MTDNGRVLFINSVCGTGSTGKICTLLADELERDGYEVKIAYGRDGFVPEKYKKYAVRIGSDLDVKMHGIVTRIFDRHGLGSKHATRKFLQWASEYNPGLLWLHNIHGYFINFELLFDWIKSRPGMKVNWTLHDCWSFTGHCSHFTLAGCYKWLTHCSNCILKKSYPSSFFMDNSYDNFERKRKAFTGVRNLKIITPSKWLADLVKKSFLNEYPVEVRYNTIDKEIFKPTQGDFRLRFGLENKFIILGVAGVWTASKGLNDFLKLATMLDSERYAIVLVGLNMHQIKSLPRGITGIERTNNQSELTEIYTAADVFFNPTYDDNYPTVNLEAEACGTPVITYDTGGCPETVQDNSSLVIHRGDLEAAVKRVKELAHDQKFSAQAPDFSHGNKPVNML